MPFKTDYVVFRGVALQFRGTPVVVQDVTGWNLQCEIGPGPSPSGQSSAALLVLDNSGMGGVVITDGPNGLFMITLTSDQNKALGVNNLCWNVWRTDVGFEDLLAYGNLNVQAVVRW